MSPSLHRSRPHTLPYPPTPPPSNISLSCASQLHLITVLLLNQLLHSPSPAAAAAAHSPWTDISALTPRSPLTCSPVLWLGRPQLPSACLLPVHLTLSGGPNQVLHSDCAHQAAVLIIVYLDFWPSCVHVTVYFKALFFYLLPFPWSSYECSHLSSLRLQLSAPFSTAAGCRVHK